jgi:hypothetical protein
MCVMLRYLLALLARLERTAGPAGPTAALPQISQMEPIKTPFPRPHGAPLGRAALHNALRRLNVAGECSLGKLAKKTRAWSPIAPHESYLQALRARHDRKRAFWAQVSAADP